MISTTQPWTVIQGIPVEQIFYSDNDDPQGGFGITVSQRHPGNPGGSDIDRETALRFLLESDRTYFDVDGSRAVAGDVIGQDDFSLATWTAGDHIVTVSGSMPVSQLVAIAQTVHQIPAAEWSGVMFQAAERSGFDNFGNYVQSQPLPVAVGTDSDGEPWKIEVATASFEDHHQIVWQWDSAGFGTPAEEDGKDHIRGRRQSHLRARRSAAGRSQRPRSSRWCATGRSPCWCRLRTPTPSSTGHSPPTCSASPSRSPLRSSAPTAPFSPTGRRHEDRRDARDHRDHRRRHRCLRRPRTQHHRSRLGWAPMGRPGCCRGTRCPHRVRHRYLGVDQQRPEGGSRSHHHDRRPEDHATGADDHRSRQAARSVLRRRPTATAHRRVRRHRATGPQLLRPRPVPVVGDQGRVGGVGIVVRAGDFGCRGRQHLRDERLPDPGRSDVDRDRTPARWTNRGPIRAERKIDRLDDILRPRRRRHRSPCPVRRRRP